MRLPALPRVSLSNRLANRRGRLATIVLPWVTEGTPLGFTATAIVDALAAGFVSGTDDLPEGVAAFRAKPPPRLNRH